MKIEKYRTCNNLDEFEKIHYEIVDHTSNVEKQGYIPAKKRIENLILAGQRLVESRNAQYDFHGEIDENFSDPTRDLSFDFADASIMARESASRLNQQALDAENKAKIQNEQEKEVEKSSPEKSGE